MSQIVHSDGIPWRGVIVVIAAALTQFPIGLLYAYSNMIPYVASYLSTVYDKPQSLTDLTWLFAMCSIGSGLTGPLGGIIEKVTGPKIIIWGAGAIFSGGLLLTYYTISMSFFMVNLTYGFMVGFGIGLGWAVPVGCAMQWFPHRTGLINGIIASSIGIGGIVFIPLQTTFINPHNSKVQDNGIFTEKDVVENTKQSFLLMGGISAILLLIGGTLIDYPKTNIKTDKEIKDNSKSMESTQTLINGRVCLSPLQVLKTKNFYVMWFSYLFLIVILNMTAGMYKMFGQTFIKDDMYIALVGSMALGFNAAGRILWGMLFDKLTYRVSMMGMCLIQTAIIGTFILTKYGGKPMFAIWVIAILVCEASIFVSIPAAVEKLWGPEYYLYNLGMVSTSQGVAGLVTALASGPILKAIGFLGLFSLVAATALTTLMIT